MIPMEPIIPITSREYKMMLVAQRFSGNDSDVKEALKQLRSAIRKTTYLEVKGKWKLDKTQEVRYWDLPEQLLYDQNNYVLRTRCLKETTSLTLKCRHGDRYFVQSQIGTAEDSKFEEDLKPRFTHLFSYSRKFDGDSPKRFTDLTDRFPDLESRIGHVDGRLRFSLVRDFAAIERVYTGMKVSLTDSFDAECAVIVWYALNEEDRERPVVAEFSFRYPRKKWREKPPPEPHNLFDGVTGLVAHKFYTDLQDSPTLSSHWLDPKSKTKTGFAYEGSS